MYTDVGICTMVGATKLLILFIAGVIGMYGTEAYAATFSVIWEFNQTNNVDGSSPNGVTRGADGAFYGTTSIGGSNTQCLDGADQGCGVFYSLTPPSSPDTPWTQTVLWNFGASPVDAFYPGPLTAGSNGVWYGMADGGNQAFAGGTIFMLAPPAVQGGEWSENVLYSFGGAPDGALPQYPNASLAIDSSGVLYGVTYYGGTSKSCNPGCGTVFSLTPPTVPGGPWTESILWDFAGGTDGAYPVAGPVLGPGGVLYGATLKGGAADRGNVFALSPPATQGGSWTKTVIHSFPKDPKLHPNSLIIASDGILYGTTNLSDAGSEGGTVFCLTPPSGGADKWAYSTLFQFPTEQSHASISHQPSGPLVLNEQTGVLFGATGNGGGLGTVFKLLPPKAGQSSWTKIVLDHTHLFVPTVSLRVADTVYGTDASEGLVWYIDSQ